MVLHLQTAFLLARFPHFASSVVIGSRIRKLCIWKWSLTVAATLMDDTVIVMEVRGCRFIEQCHLDRFPFYSHFSGILSVTGGTVSVEEAEEVRRRRRRMEEEEEEGKADSAAESHGSSRGVSRFSGQATEKRPRISPSRSYRWWPTTRYQHSRSRLFRPSRTQQAIWRNYRQNSREIKLGVDGNQERNTDKQTESNSNMANVIRYRWETLDDVGWDWCSL